MPGRLEGLRLLAELLVGLLLVVLIAYISARLGLGNPFSRLGVEGFLDPREASTLRHVYGLDKPILNGFLSFVSSLLRGDTGPSIIYGVPAFALTLTYLPWTLVAIVAGFVLAFLTASLWAILFGVKIPRPVRWLSFTPGYFYALVFVVASWWVGWPTPGVGHGLDKFLAYMSTVWLTLWPRLLHGLAGAVEDASVELSMVMLVSRAIGLGDYMVNYKVYRSILAPYVAYASTMLGMVLERSVLLEPLLGYSGVGLLLYRGVVDADPVLAATAFAVLGAIAYLVVAIGNSLERVLDPRL